MKKVTLLLMCIAFVIFCGMLGCSKESSTSDEETIKIGCSFPLTFKGAEAASQSRVNAVLLAAEEVNKNGGILGKKIEILIRDNEFDTVKCVSLADEMINLGAKAIIGCSSSSRTSVTARKSTIPKNVILISPPATSPTLTNLADNNLVFRTAPSDVFQGKVAADYAYKTAGKKTAGIIFFNDIYGVGLAENFKTQFEKLGGQVLNFVPYDALNDYSAYDFTSKVNTLFTGNPELIFFVSMANDGSKIMNVIAANINLSYKPQFMGCESLYSDDFLPPNTPAAIIEGMIGTLPLDAGATNENYQIFKTNYKAKFGIEPISFAANTYDAAYLIFYGMLKAKSTNSVEAAKYIEEISKTGEIIKVGEYAKAKAALESGKDIDYNGASGNLELDAHGDVTVGTFLIWKIENGKFKNVTTVSFP